MVCVGFLNEKMYPWYFFSAEARLFLVCFEAYIPAVGNTPYGKRHTSRTVYVKPLQSILTESLHSRQLFWYCGQITWTHSWTRKMPQIRTLQNNTPPAWKTYEFSRHRCCLTLTFGDNVTHSHSDRCQPLTDRKARATQSSYKYGLGAGEWPIYKHSFCLVQKQQGVLLVVVEKSLGWTQAFF